MGQGRAGGGGGRGANVSCQLKSRPFVNLQKSQSRPAWSGLDLPLVYAVRTAFLWLLRLGRIWLVNRG